MFQLVECSLASDRSLQIQDGHEVRGPVSGLVVGSTCVWTADSRVRAMLVYARERMHVGGKRTCVECFEGCGKYEDVSCCLSLTISGYLWQRLQADSAVKSGPSLTTLPQRGSADRLGAEMCR